MNFQQLRSIREAVRRGYNLTEVAQALFTSQPGVSRQIRELEEELGIEIFERNGKRLIGLTEPGKGILPIVDRLLLEAENLRHASQEFSGETSGTLTVALVNLSDGAPDSPLATCTITSLTGGVDTSDAIAFAAKFETPTDVPDKIAQRFSSA